MGKVQSVPLSAFCWGFLEGYLWARQERLNMKFPHGLSDRLLPISGSLGISRKFPFKDHLFIYFPNPKIGKELRHYSEGEPEDAKSPVIQKFLKKLRIRSG